MAVAGRYQPDLGEHSLVADAVAPIVDVENGPGRKRGGPRHVLDRFDLDLKVRGCAVAGRIANWNETRLLVGAGLHRDRVAARGADARVANVGQRAAGPHPGPDG